MGVLSWPEHSSQAQAFAISSTAAATISDL